MDLVVMTPQTYPEELALKTGFRPWNEMTTNQHLSVFKYIDKYYVKTFDPTFYFWKESETGDGNWISFDTRPVTRIAAPHLKRT
jgi:hypothetical protein